MKIKKDLKREDTSKNRSDRKFNEFIAQKQLDKKFKEAFDLSKGYTDERFDRIFKYLDYRFDPLEEFRKEMLKFKDKVLDRLDWLIGKYQKFEDEYTIQNEHNGRILDRIENYEKRISSLESKKVLH